MLIPFDQGHMTQHSFCIAPVPGPGSHLPPQAEPIIIAKMQDAVDCGVMQWPSQLCNAYSVGPTMATGWNQLANPRFVSFGPHRRPPELWERTAPRQVKISTLSCNDVWQSRANPVSSPPAGVPTIHQQHMHHNFMMEPTRSQRASPSFHDNLIYY